MSSDELALENDDNSGSDTDERSPLTKKKD